MVTSQRRKKKDNASIEDECSMIAKMNKGIAKISKDLNEETKRIDKLRADIQSFVKIFGELMNTHHPCTAEAVAEEEKEAT
jgi:uncharacterized membrane protein